MRRNIMKEREKYKFSRVLMENDLVVMDTCSIFSAGFIKLFQQNAKSIVQLERPVILHQAVVNELIRISKTPEHLKYRDAKNILPILNVLENAKVFKYVGDSKDVRFADQQFLEYIVNSRINNKIVLITLDKKLTADILLQNESLSYHGNKVRVLGLSNEGELYESFNVKASMSSVVLN